MYNFFYNAWTGTYVILYCTTGICTKVFFHEICIPVKTLHIGDQRMCKVRLLCKKSFFILWKIEKYWYTSNQLLVQIVSEFINNLLNVIYFIIECTGSDVLYCTTGISRKVLLCEFYLDQLIHNKLRIDVCSTVHRCVYILLSYLLKTREILVYQ